MSEEHSQVSLQEETGADKARKRPGRRALLALGIVAGVLVAACAAVCGVAAASDTVLRGTSVLGVDLSGLNTRQIQELWEKEGQAACDRAGISFLMDDEEPQTVSLGQLGVSVKAEDVARDAWDAGHGGNFLTNGWRLLRSWFCPTEVQPRLSFDEKALRAAVEKLGEDLGTPAVDGAYRLEKENGGLYITKPCSGVRVDSEELYRAVKQDMDSGVLDSVVCVCAEETGKPIDLDAVYEEIHGEMANAGYDVATGEITDSRVGVEFDVDQARKLLEKAQPGEEFAVPATVTFPAVSKEELKEVLFRDRLGTYTTYVSGSSNRLFNVRRAAASVNGTVINSGGVFSYNEVVGNTDQANGYLPAPGYMQGKTVDMYGGGVCQVSSTLYYATLLSNLEIVTRFCHQFVPGYITWGCDATVSDGWPDYCFRNNTDYPIKIVTDYSDDCLTVSIYGTKLDDSYVVITSETLSSTPSKTEYKEDSSLKPGATREEQSGYTGYHVRTWRNVYAGDDTLISSEVEADSYYEMRPTIILVGPKKTESKPKPAPEPEKPAEEPGADDSEVLPDDGDN